jgi:surfactin synthase thioesterase subunit
LAVWIRSFCARPDARARLFCFSYAGVGASAFRLWHEGLPPELEVCAIQLPGRESRLDEPALSSVPRLVELLVPQVRAHARAGGDRPFAFFGHSMGATLAFEVARTLQCDGAPMPVHVFLSARRPPSVPDPDPPLSHLADAEFVAELNRRYGGIPAEVLAHQELLALLLPALRADLTALESFRSPPLPLLSAPVSVFGGHDDSRAPRSYLEAWRAHVAGTIRLRQFPGGHFYLNQARERDAVLAEVRSVLAPLLEGTAQREAL